MRPLWSGSINFGLINIPVRLFSGSQSNTLDLDMLPKGEQPKPTNVKDLIKLLKTSIESQKTKAA